VEARGGMLALRVRVQYPSDETRRRFLDPFSFTTRARPRSTRRHPPAWGGLRSRRPP